MNEVDRFDLEDEKIEVIRANSPFKLNQIKIEYFHWNDNEVEKGRPISTSIEYKLIEEKWIKKVSHRFYYLTNGIEIKNNEYEEDLISFEEIINLLEEYDLRNLKNNYYTNIEPENYSHWEITYNYLFKIVGTDDQLTAELENIFKIMNLKEIIDEEKLKVLDMFS